MLESPQAQHEGMYCQECLIEKSGAPEDIMMTWQAMRNSICSVYTSSSVGS